MEFYSNQHSDFRVSPHNKMAPFPTDVLKLAVD